MYHGERMNYKIYVNKVERNMRDFTTGKIVLELIQ